MQKNYHPFYHAFSRPALIAFLKNSVSTSVIISRILISSNFQTSSNKLQYRCNIAPFHDFMDCLIELTKQGHIKL